MEKEKTRITFDNTEYGTETASFEAAFSKQNNVYGYER